MSNPADRLASWILEKAQEETPRIRAQVYRDAAETLAGGAAAEIFLRLAIETERIDDLYHQLLLELQQDDGEMRGPPSKEDVPQ